MIDKLIGVIIVLAIIAGAIILVFFGLWLVVFCKTFKMIDKTEKDFNREWRHLR